MGDSTMGDSSEPASVPARHWTMRELRSLPAEERAAILMAAAESAREEYLNNPDLTAGEVQWGGVERDDRAQAG